MQDLQRIRFVTQNYHTLQGLRILPIAVWFFVLALLSGFWRNPPMTVVLMTCLLGLIISLLMSQSIKKYYEHHFGRIKPKRKSRQQEWIEQVGWAVGVVILWGLTTVSAENTTSLPIIVSASLAYPITLYFRKGWCFQRHYFIIPLVMLGVGLLPLLFGFPIDSHLAHPLAFAYFVLGIGLTLQGIFDHQCLVRTLKPVMEDENGEVI